MTNFSSNTPQPHKWRFSADFRVANYSELIGSNFRYFSQKVPIFAKNVHFLNKREMNFSSHMPSKVAPMCSWLATLAHTYVESHTPALCMFSMILWESRDRQHAWATHRTIPKIKHGLWTPSIYQNLPNFKHPLTINKT